MVKVKRKILRKTSEKPVASPKRGGMIGGLEVGRAHDQEKRLAYIEQIKRDMAVLRENPIYHVPSRQFYENRILQYRRALGVKHSPPVGTSGEKQLTETRPTPRVWVRLKRKR